LQQENGINFPPQRSVSCGKRKPLQRKSFWSKKDSNNEIGERGVLKVEKRREWCQGEKRVKRLRLGVSRQECGEWHNEKRRKGTQKTGQKYDPSRGRKKRVKWNGFTGSRRRGNAAVDRRGKPVTVPREKKYGKLPKRGRKWCGWGFFLMCWFLAERRKETCSEHIEGFDKAKKHRPLKLRNKPDGKRVSKRMTGRWGSGVLRHLKKKRKKRL